MCQPEVLEGYFLLSQVSFRPDKYRDKLTALKVFLNVRKH